MYYLASFLSIFLSIYDNPASRFLFSFDGGELFFKLDGVCYESARVCLNQHELEHVYLLVCDPSLVEFLEMFGHIIDYLLNSYIYIVFYDAFVDVANNRLDYTELLEKFSSCVEHLLTEYILLAIHPQIGETFLSGVENLSKVAEGTLFVQDFVGFGKLISVVSWGAVAFIDFTKAFHLVKEPFAGSLSVL